MDNGVCYWRCAKRTCPARIITEGNQTAPHNHAVNVVDTQVKAIYNDHLIRLSTHSDRDSIAQENSGTREQWHNGKLEKTTTSPTYVLGL